MPRIPTALKPGDTIGICSTARKVRTDEISYATKLIEEWGYQVKLGKTIGLVENQFAGSDQERADDLSGFFTDTSVKAICCARGGYGTARVLPLLDAKVIAANPKWLVGFSDVTALHAWLQHNADLASLHAAMPITFPDNHADALESLRKSLAGDFQPIQLTSHQYNLAGSARGKLVGGNLSVLHSILGTDFDPIQEGCILFIEDVDEYLYHIDRMMQHLLLIGKLDVLSGLIVGGLTDMNDNEVPFGLDAESIVREKMGAFNKPVAFGFPAGHISSNFPLVLGAEVELTVNEALSTLSYLSQPK